MNRIRVAIGLSLLMSMGVLTACGQPPQEATPPGNSGAPVAEIPEVAQQQALGWFQAEYGQVRDIYGEAQTTRGQWRELEPNLTSGLIIDETNEDEPVYALFLRGQFHVPSSHPTLGEPIENNELPSPGTKTPITARIVFDEQGDLKTISMWGIEKSAKPPFGPPFEDN